jgi:hypothetical protein
MIAAVLAASFTALLPELTRDLLLPLVESLSFLSDNASDICEVEVVEAAVERSNNMSEKVRFPELDVDERGGATAIEVEATGCSVLRRGMFQEMGSLVTTSAVLGLGPSLVEGPSSVSSGSPSSSSAVAALAALTADGLYAAAPWAVLALDRSSSILG